MADIRINSLPSTASASSSDDFLALDGATNGTRKLNAFSPTFGGNLTVSGTGTSTINNLSIAPTSGHVYLTGPSAAGKFITLQNGNATGGINFRDSTGNEVGSYYQVTDAWTFSKNTTVSGNLTVSGTGVNTFNVGAGTSVVSLNSTAATPTWISMTSGATTLGSIARTGNDLIISGGNSGAALTLTYGATQTATITGNLTVSGTGTSSVAGYLGVGRTDISASVGLGFFNVTYPYAKTDTTLRNVASWSSNEAAGSTWKLILTSKGNATATSRFFSLQTSNEGVANNGILALQDNGGVVTLGTSTNSGNGIIQLADHTTSAGGIGFGTDVSLFRSAAGVLRLASTANYSHEIVNTGGTGAASTSYSNTGGYLLVGIDSSSGGALGGGAYAGVISRDGAYSLIFRTNSTTALTLDSSQNATFAGKVTAGTWADVVSARLGVATSANSYTATIANNASSGGAYALRLHTTGTASSDYIVVGSSGASAGSVRFLADGAGNFVVNNAAIATTATDGFLYVSTCAGTPTGTPTSYTGRAPIVVDTTNNKLYFYSGGAWRDAGP